MKRALRLRHPEQFRRVRNQGQRFVSPLLTLYMRIGRPHRLRCGFVVGKYLGGAVIRNRAKRRVREAVRLALPYVETGYDLVFVVRKPEVGELPFPQLQQLVEGLLRQAKLWRSV
ncbi:ribonuclease P protein component [Candidatus Chloroploca asiatica]|uniref:Ribonuclease P protein component n=1 Tax=Candidatus Chloroploca asiatica TaxID=1506545 RepID=A0A2H3KZL4_9CHLR|nr:ribonuclease P protein component [Candidatus Chloroploca asiatica]